MDVQFLLAIYGLFLCLACLVPFWLDQPRFKASTTANRRYKLTIFSVEVPISGELLMKLLSYFALLQVLDVLTPRYLAWFIVLVIAARTSRFFSFGHATPLTDAQSAMTRLMKAQAEFVSAKLHLDALTSAIASEAERAREQQQLKIELEAEIARKAADKAEWDKLSEEQREYWARKAYENVPKASALRDFVFFGLGIVGNIVASALWSLIGNPSKDEINKYFGDLLAKVIGA